MVQVEVKKFRDQGIKVIVIVLGSESDVVEFKDVVIDDCYVICVKKIEDFDKLVVEVMEFVFKGIVFVIKLQCN